jgi:hypothetical protein
MQEHLEDLQAKASKIEAEQGKCDNLFLLIDEIEEIKADIAEAEGTFNKIRRY